MKKIMSIAALASITMYSVTANSASDTAAANAIVTAAIGISQVSDLEFGSAAQGDIAKTVAPGTSEDAENASFAVTGQASTAYTITLPANSTVVMLTGDGVGATKQIAVDNFVSYPVAGANGLLDGSGAQSLFVGASRAAILPTQVAGSYTTTFTVDVVY